MDEREGYDKRMTTRREVPGHAKVETPMDAAR
jgi:hypothetical protein